MKLLWPWRVIQPGWLFWPSFILKYQKSVFWYKSKWTAVNQIDPNPARSCIHQDQHDGFIGSSHWLILLHTASLFEWMRLTIRQIFMVSGNWYNLQISIQFFNNENSWNNENAGMDRCPSQIICLFWIQKNFKNFNLKFSFLREVLMTKIITKMDS